MFQFDEPFGSTIFCDDIRTEVGGKNSYMGVYTGNMAVPSFPATVSKFGVVTSIFEPRAMAEARDWDVIIKLYLPGDDPEHPTLTGPLPPVPQEAYQMIDNSKLPDDPEVPKLVILTAAFILAPMLLREPGRIKVRATYREGVTLKLGSIKIEQLSQGTAQVIGSR